MCTNKASSADKSKISKLAPIDYSLSTLPKDLNDKFKEKAYITQCINIKKSEEPNTINELDEPKNADERIFNMILRYDNEALSDIDSNNEDEQNKGEPYKKGKKKGKGKKGKGKKGKGKKGKKKKGKK